MASRSGRGWREQVRVVGYPPECKSFRTKAEALLWKETRRAELLAGKRGEYPKKTLREAAERFRLEIAPTHKGERWERVRCLKFERDPICDRLLISITDNDMARWRNDRLKQVSSGTVRRELVLWGQIFEAAREVFRWTPRNIMRDVKKPAGAKARPRAIPPDHISQMVKTLGTAHKSRETALGFLLGCETAMRPWEMIPLEKAQVAWRDCTAHLDDTKNGDERDVPLSPGAIEILAELDAMNPGERFFTVAEGSVTAMWAEARLEAGLSGFHFRHSRREGIRRLSERLEILELARAVGHRDLNSLLIYYQKPASEMARKLQGTPSRSQLSTEDAPRPRSEPGTETSGDKLS